MLVSTLHFLKLIPSGTVCIDGVTDFFVISEDGSKERERGRG